MVTIKPSYDKPRKKSGPTVPVLHSLQTMFKGRNGLGPVWFSFRSGFHLNLNYLLNGWKCQPNLINALLCQPDPFQPKLCMDQIRNCHHYIIQQLITNIVW